MGARRPWQAGMPAVVRPSRIMMLIIERVVQSTLDRRGGHATQLQGRFRQPAGGAPTSVPRQARRIRQHAESHEVLGRLLFSAMRASVPTMWKDFLALLSMLASNWSDTYLRLHNEASDLLKHMQWRLNHDSERHPPGVTPYTLRPGANHSTGRAAQ
eukprot:SAG11_NODE_5247_length_1616_cov_7.811470_2_plen_157_part_00